MKMYDKQTDPTAQLESLTEEANKAFNVDLTQPEPDDSNGLPMEPTGPQIKGKFFPAEPNRLIMHDVTLYYDVMPTRDMQVVVAVTMVPGRPKRESNMIVREYTQPGDTREANAVFLTQPQWMQALDAMLDHLGKSIPAGKCLCPELPSELAELEDWSELIDSINTVRAHLLESNYGQQPCRMPF